MAVKGTYGAYSQAREVGSDVSSNLKHAERMGFRYRSEDRRSKEKKRDRRKKQADELGVSLDEMNIKETGIKDIDAPVFDYMNRASDKLTELSTRISENPDDYEAQILYKKYENSAKHLKGFIDKYRDWNLDYKEGVANGDYSKTLNKNVPDKISRGLLNGDYKIINDKNGDLQLLIDMDGDGEQDKYADLDGDGEKEDLATINIPQFLSGNELYNPKEAHSRYEVQDEIAGRFGTVDITEDKEGYIERQYKGFDKSKMPELIQEVDDTLGTHENMTDKAISIIGDDMGINYKKVTKEQFKRLKTKFVSDIVNTFDKTKTDEIDHLRRNADQSNYRANKRLAWDEEDRNNRDAEEDGIGLLEPAIGSDDQLVREDKFGNTGTVLNFDPSINAEIDGMKADRVVLFDDGNIGVVVQQEGTTPRINDNGTIGDGSDDSYDVGEDGEPITEPTTSPMIIKDQNKLNKFALSLGFSNASEMAKYASRKVEGGSMSQEQQDGLNDIDQQEGI